MKQLTLIRHAKSSWDYPSLTDHDRPLGERGLRDAPRMGQHLYHEGLVVDLMITSTALRALSTAQIIARELALREPLRLEPECYDTGSDGDVLLSIASGLPDDITSVAFVGHNETMRRLVMGLSQGEIMEFPTCAVASFIYQIDSWDQILDEDYPDLEFFVAPKIIE